MMKGAPAGTSQPGALSAGPPLPPSARTRQAAPRPRPAHVRAAKLSKTRAPPASPLRPRRWTADPPQTIRWRCQRAPAPWALCWDSRRRRMPGRAHCGRVHLRWRPHGGVPWLAAVGTSPCAAAAAWAAWAWETSRRCGLAGSCTHTLHTCHAHSRTGLSVQRCTPGR